MNLGSHDPPLKQTKQSRWEDGEEYPLAKVPISSTSHPFFTGTMTIVDTAGRVDGFEKRYGKRKRSSDSERINTNSTTKAMVDSTQLEHRNIAKARSG